MSRADLRRFRGILPSIATLLLIGQAAFSAETSKQEYGPDPATVQRYGPAYRYPQSGWIVLHIEGEPYDRGYQHGRLMAPEIADYLKTLASKRSPKAPGEAWQANRMLVDALFLRRYDKEYLEEMKGTADGAAAAGATFEGRPVDLLDVVAINSEIEVDFLENALDSTARGLEGKTFREPSDAPPKPPKADHCSAFAAVGPATADGQVVFGHITMWNLVMSRHFNVWIDVKPAQGHRVVMQTYPGGIQSGMDYYMNDAGLVVCETTISQTKFDPEGQALASRIRKALQYGDSIDSAVAILSKKNNGLYTNEWLMADTKANEIAMFELGTSRTKLWRSSKNEWFGGTEGFYWGCNNGKDLDVRLESIPSVEEKPANLVWRASDRDRAWLSLFHEFKGKINADFGIKAFTTPPLSAYPSLDAKVTTAAMAKELKSWAIFGPPIGRLREPTESQKRIPGVRPLIPNDWTILSAEAPPQTPDVPVAVDLVGVQTSNSQGNGEHPPAWRGTILPKGDADAWLAASFADYEEVVAMEKALKGDAADRVELALFGARSRYRAATRRMGQDVALSKLQSDPAKTDWYEIAAGKGLLLMAALREKIGPDKFDAMMDEFGRSHAGHAVDSAQFRGHAEKAAGQPLADFFTPWLDETGLPGTTPPETWAVDSFEEEPEKAVIVYGTLKEANANREAATRLQTAIAARWSNVIVPIKPDTEFTEDDWKEHHVLLIGRPAANAATARAAGKLPVSFGPASFTLREKTYAHPGTAVIVAGENPLNPRYQVVAFAGLGAESTWKSVEHVGARRGNHPEVVLIAEGSSARDLVARPVEKDKKVADATRE
ncbi:C45 family autoproteolytic acyltransferase/hydrolase [Tundrisphaera lichenicola]|uniref:C45 family autoproteolytic acyltransferase/hydolase n=1 Tax=Tundrisphaera lichenicola TaxID=2029860 RepID=UPI003EBAFFE4